MKVGDLRQMDLAYPDRLPIIPAATLRQYAWAAFEAALFTATEEPSA